MRRSALLAAVLTVTLGWPWPILGQSITNVQPKVASGSLTASDAGTCTISSTACVVLIPNGYTVISVQLAGTWTGTVQFETCIVTCSTAGNWQSMLLTPPGSTTAVSSVTSTNGIWNGSAPANFFRVRVSSFGTGTIVVSALATLGPIPSTSLNSFGGNCATGTADDIQITDGSNHCVTDPGVFHYHIPTHFEFVNNIESNAATNLSFYTPGVVSGNAPDFVFTGGASSDGGADTARGGGFFVTTGTNASTSGITGPIRLTTADGTFGGDITLQVGHSAALNNAGGLNATAGTGGIGGSLLASGTGGTLRLRGGASGTTTFTPGSGPGGDAYLESGYAGTLGGPLAKPGVIHFLIESGLDSGTDCQGSDQSLSGTFSWNAACGFFTAAQLSSALDSQFGSAQGDILYRGASAWTVLAPGSSGQALETGGAGANPSWQTLSGTGTVTHTAGALTAGENVVGNGSADIKVQPCTDGQVPIGATSDNTVSCSTLTAGTNVTITNAGHSITINANNTAGNSGTLIDYVTFTTGTSATYTPSAGTNSVIVEMVGGGGGGGGVATGSPGDWNLAAGGGGAGYCRVRLTSGFSGATYTVGAGGAGGAAGANNGSAGGNTTFISTVPTTYTAGGGPGGANRGGPFAAPIDSGVTAGGTSSGCDINTPGGISSYVLIPTSSILGGSGGGGASFWSGGTIPNINPGSNVSVVGANAAGQGGGGSGAVCQNSCSTARAGGNGSGGMIVIWEYR